jgi:hypothetical protein
MASKKQALPDPVAIDKFLSKVVQANLTSNRINRIGIELEGGWKKLPPHTNLTRDSSIHIDDPDGNIHIGELPSPPLALEEWQKWMKTCYPSHTNESCGLHTHMSFKSALTYQRLMDPRYLSTMVAYLIMWAKSKGFPSTHPIWPRLEDKSEYCQHRFYADMQIRDTRKDFDHNKEGCRYTAISYHYSRLGTIECRILPMMETVDEGIEAVKQVLDITNAYLLATNVKEKKVPVSVISDGEKVVRDSTISYV